MVRDERPGERGTPMVIAQPAMVSFAFVAQPKVQVAPLHLKNIGSAPLLIEKLTLSGSASFKVRATGAASWALSSQHPAANFDDPIVVAAGESLRVIIEHHGAGHDAQTAMLRVLSNDPTREVSLAVGFQANVEPSCLQLSPQEQLDFGKVDVGTCRTKLVDARNCGKVPVVIEDAALLNTNAETPFSVSWGTGEAGQPWIDQQVATGTASSVMLEPASKLSLAVTYCPAKALAKGVADSALLEVVSSAPGTQHVVCRGVPQLPSCPKAVAGIAQVDAAQVGSKLQLTSFDSKATTGTILKWKWTLAAPSISTAKLLPSIHSPAPSFTVDVAGSYTFCVDVWDSGGAKACQSSCLTIHATETATYGANHYSATPVW